MQALHAGQEQAAAWARKLTDDGLSVRLCRCSDEDASPSHYQVGQQPPSLQGKSVVSSIAEKSGFRLGLHNILLLGDSAPRLPPLAVHVW